MAPSRVHIFSSGQNISWGVTDVEISRIFIDFSVPSLTQVWKANHVKNLPRFCVGKNIYIFFSVFPLIFWPRQFRVLKCLLIDNCNIINKQTRMGSNLRDRAGTMDAR